MFTIERPINEKKEDILHRNKFSQYFGNAIIGWNESDSLVIGLYGEWGSGKTSIINLARKHIESLEIKNKPTFIEFNPWSFSEQGNLTKYFFNEIAKELELNGNGKDDKKIADKIRHYNNILSFVPTTTQLSTIYFILLSSLSLMGLSISALDLINNKLILGVIVFILLFSFISEYAKNLLLKFASYLDSKSKLNTKTIIEIKSEIINYLKNRKKKIIIVIDDIDRLNQNEIKEIFKLVRVNADFPNTIYILPFDRKIIEANLDEQNGVSGKEYLNKIIQVNFDVPFSNIDTIHNYLFTELDSILSTLPKVYNDLWEKGHWADVYNSGFKDFFKNIRDIKRFSNSLRFNIGQLHNGEVIEVNPIDFIGLEALRIFTPDLYNYIKSDKTMFTYTDSSYVGLGGDDNRKKIKSDFEKKLSTFEKNNLNNGKKLLFALFPNIKGICDSHGNINYGNDWQKEWSKKQMICSSNYFETYFSFLPGFDKGTMSKLDINIILNSISSLDKFENLLNDNIEKETINKVLKTLQDYTSDTKIIAEKHIINIIQGLFNISDKLPDDEKGGIFSFVNSAETNLGRVTFQLLKRERDKNENYNILLKTIPSSKGIYGVLRVLGSILGDDKPSDEIIELDKHNKIKEIVIKKIKDFAIEGKILGNNSFFKILYIWKKYGTKKDFKKYIESFLENNEKLLNFLDNFISKTKSESGKGVEIKTNFAHNVINDFYNKEQIKNINNRVLNIKSNDKALYKKHKNIIDLYFNEEKEF